MNTKNREKPRVPLPADSDGARPEPKPIKPLEPLENTQPEIPKVGTTDAPGG